FPDTRSHRGARTKRRLLTAALHLLQPLARLRGRLREGLTPWRCRGTLQPAPLWPVTSSMWSERWQAQEQRLEFLKATLREEAACVLLGGEHDRWDLAVRSGFFGGARLLMGVEDHGGGQLVRLRWWPYVPAFGPVRGSPDAILLFAIGLLVAVAALGQVQTLAGTLLRAYVGERLVLDFRARLVEQVQRLSASYHDSRGTADSVYRIQQDAAAIQ